MNRKLLHLLLPIALMIVSSSQATAADTSPPNLVDWSNSAGANITISDGILTANFIVSDDSDIELPKLILKSITTTQMTSFASVRMLKKNGNLTSYEATATILKGQAPREWEWVLYPMRDSLGNQSSVFGPGLMWKPTVKIFNGDYTVETSRCEKNVLDWNKVVTLLEDAERKFPGYAQFSIYRLKSQAPLTKLEDSKCPIPDFSSITSGLDILVMRDQLLGIIDSVQAQSSEAADKAAADKAAADKAAADKAAADKITQDAKNEAVRILAEAKAAATKKITITCVKAKQTKKVTAANPKCPSGYKKKA